ncbi:hypothetical protein X749_20615 [Mesorhizobium sp. LNJC391B00]|nr:hypothetical protein X749_20615 [Mesorhizobium sp. LNJC391B00]
MLLDFIGTVDTQPMKTSAGFLPELLETARFEVMGEPLC